MSSRSLETILYIDDTERSRQGTQTSFTRSLCSLLRILPCILFSLGHCSNAFVSPRHVTLQRPRAHPHPSSTAITGIKGFRAWFESQFPHAISAIDKETANDSFDHVLIDMNQLLHISLRRALNHGHALAMLMKELDACIDLATPTKSLVLAMDGPPSAAKLATQRRRRFGTLVRSGWKQKQLSRFRKALSKRQEFALRRRYTSEVKTLCITPGTDFMKSAEQSLLYWAWQRLQNPRHALSNVKIYISSSLVPGEGEIKLLEWILQRNRNGESIAIMGGDSDLVVEGLIIPPASSHNVFVLLPDGSRRYLAVSLWETTRALSRLLPGIQGEDVMRVRTDLVVLLILNGNDYLPKLRGASGFNMVFHTYLKLVHKWLKDPNISDRPFLIDPDSLNFNLPFCIDFFQQLIPEQQFLHDADTIRKNGLHTITPLGHLNNLVDSAFMPKPMRWSLIDNEGHVQSLVDKEEEELMDFEINESDDDSVDDNVWRLRLTLGKEGTEEYYLYETHHKKGVKVKTTKNLLAGIALDDLMGTEYENDISIDDEMTNGLSSVGYPWEVQHPLNGKVDTYLKGIIWNVQTYQDGVCVDYGYNYGKRMSPLALEIVSYFKDALKDGRDVGRCSLSSDAFDDAVSAGVACLAALPSQIQELIPEPYRKLSNTTVEDIYASCMDPHDNVFNMKEFERRINDEVRMLGFNIKSSQESVVPIDVDRGRRILCSDHAWTVLSRSNVPLEHPFAPPVPFSDHFSVLKSNTRIRVGRSIAATRPRERNIWPQNPKKDTHHSSFVVKQNELPLWTHGDVGDLLKTIDGTTKSIFDVSFKTGYKKLGAQTNTKENDLQTPAMIALGFKSTQRVKNGQDKESIYQEDKRKATMIAKSQTVSLQTSQKLVEIKLANPSRVAGSISASKLNGLDKKSKAKELDMEQETTAHVELEGIDTRKELFISMDKVPKHQSFSKLKKGQETNTKNKKLLVHTVTARTQPDDIFITRRMVKFNITKPPEDPLRNPEKKNASMLLNQLEQANLLKFTWDSVIPSPTEFASFNPGIHECIRLNIQAGKIPLTVSLGKNGRSYEQDRDVHNQPKQHLKLHIASMALQDLLGPGNSWFTMTFKEMEDLLQSI